jgi:hypothetical protein
MAVARQSKAIFDGFFILERLPVMVLISLTLKLSRGNQNTYAKTYENIPRQLLESKTPIQSMRPAMFPNVRGSRSLSRGRAQKLIAESKRVAPAQR